MEHLQLSKNKILKEISEKGLSLMIMLVKMMNMKISNNLKGIMKIITKGLQLLFIRMKMKSANAIKTMILHPHSLKYQKINLLLRKKISLRILLLSLDLI